MHDALRLEGELQPAAAAFDVEPVGPAGLQIQTEYSSRYIRVFVDIPPLHGQDEVPRLKAGALGRRARSDGSNEAAFL